MNRSELLDHPQAPRFWRHEVSGVLERPITRFLKNGGLSADDILLIRAYLRQWIDSPLWDIDIDDDGRRDLAELRTLARLILTRRDIHQWIDKAVGLGMDPL